MNARNWSWKDGDHAGEANQYEIHWGNDPSGISSICSITPAEKQDLCHLIRRSGSSIMPNKVEIFPLQKLMGHSDLQILRRYLAQTDQDIQTAHMRGSPVDSNL